MRRIASSAFAPWPCKRRAPTRRPPCVPSPRYVTRQGSHAQFDHSAQHTPSSQVPAHAPGAPNSVAHACSRQHTSSRNQRTPWAHTATKRQPSGPRQRGCRKPPPPRWWWPLAMCPLAWRRLTRPPGGSGASPHTPGRAPPALSAAPPQSQIQTGLRGRRGGGREGGWCEREEGMMIGQARA